MSAKPGPVLKFEKIETLSKQAQQTHFTKRCGRRQKSDTVAIQERKKQEKKGNRANARHHWGMRLIFSGKDNLLASTEHF